MQQLSGMDNLCLEIEDSRQHMHIAALGLYDPATAPGGSLRFKTLLDFFAGKVDEVPFFRRRLRTAPLGLDRPYWIEDADVDVEYHVRHLALPKPGDWRQLMIQVARLHSRPLDRARPLWEVYVIGGLDNVEGIAAGSFAIYLKMHHAAVDGQAAAQLVGVLHSAGPQPDPVTDAPVVFTDREPGNIELIARSAINRGRQAIGASRLVLSVARSAATVGPKHGPGALAAARAAIVDWASDAGDPAPGGRMASPGNRFDRNVSPHRIVDAIGLPLEKCQRIRRSVAGVTINDIFLATTGGAIRSYLQAHGELPGKSVNAMMPMASARSANTPSANSVSMAIVDIATDVEDPLERLVKIGKATARSKAMQDDIGRDLFMRLFDVVPASVARTLSDLLVQRNCSLAVSNVRGPDVPLYLAGARAQVIMPVSIPSDGVGLNVTGFSYLGTLWVCMTACREIVPDPNFLASCMQRNFDELVAAAESVENTIDPLPAQA